MPGFQIFAEQDSHPWFDEISNSRHCTSILFLLDNLQPLMEELFSVKLLHRYLHVYIICRCYYYYYYWCTTWYCCSRLIYLNPCLPCLDSDLCKVQCNIFIFSRVSFGVVWAIHVPSKYCHKELKHKCGWGGGELKHEGAQGGGELTKKCVCVCVCDGEGN